MASNSKSKLFLILAVVFIIFGAALGLTNISGLYKFNKEESSKVPKFDSSLVIPIFIDGDYKIASTSAGTRILNVSPDQAVDKLVKNQLVSKVDEVVLLEVDGIPVYEIKALKIHRLIGIIPLTIPIKIKFSPETGEIIKKEQSKLANIIDLIAF